jgi:hypothetical protein
LRLIGRDFTVCRIAFSIPVSGLLGSLAVGIADFGCRDIVGLM